MARQELRTFKNIYDAVMQMMKLQASDTVSRDRIKRDLNQAYINEVLSYKQWPWLRKSVNIQHQAAYGTGTASVTSNSVTVTLSDTITESKKGFHFSTDSYQEIYTIKSHTAGSATLTLDVPYGSSTAATAKFKIWQSLIDLPTDLDALTEVRHQFQLKPMTGVGYHDLRELEALGPKAEARPSHYSLTDFAMPDAYASITGLPASAARSSSGVVKTIRFVSGLGTLLTAGDRIEISGASYYAYNETGIVSNVSTTTFTNDTITYTSLVPYTEAATADTGITVKKLDTESYDRRKQLLIYPSIFNARTTLSVDYVSEAPYLEDDTDEPIIPLKDRIVLFWLGLSYAYSRERMPEEAAMYRNMAEVRLAKMGGSTDESSDKPTLTPSRLYLSTKRSVRTRARGTGGEFSANAFGGGSALNPTGTPSQVAVFGTDGQLQSSSLVSTTELNYLDGLVDNVQDQLDALGLSGAVGNRALYSNTDSPPAITESTVTGTSLTNLLDAEPLTTVTLTDNTAVAALVAGWTVATYSAIQIMYTIKRSTAYETGIINLVSDGTNAAIAQGAVASIGANGVTFSADVNAGSLRLLYTTTSTGTNATLKYKVHKWLA